jgi:hypothetical protein
MLQPEGRYDGLILWIVTHVPGRAVGALAGLSYFGFGLVLPIVVGLPAIVLFDMNVIGTIFAASLLFGWLIVQIQFRDRRHLLDWSSDLRLLDGEEFEWLVGEIFRRDGWTVSEHGRQDAADGNIDLELRRGSERRLVQCKRWTSQWVPVDEIRRFLGTLTRMKLEPSDGIFVTLSRFNVYATREAEEAGLELIDNAELLRRVDNVRRSEPCPICSQPMILGRSLHGWWFRCQTPGCTGKRDLGRDPGRAVALITDQAGSGSTVRTAR